MRSRLCIRASPQRLNQRCAWGRLCLRAALPNVARPRADRLAFKRLSILIYFPATQMTSCRSSHSATGGLSIGRCTASCPLLSLLCSLRASARGRPDPRALGSNEQRYRSALKQDKLGDDAAAGSVNAGSSVPRVSGRAGKEAAVPQPSASGRGRAAAAKGRSIHG